MELSLFQARYVEYLDKKGCTWRAMGGNFFARYNDDLTQKTKYEPYRGFGGNQIDGMDLTEAAIKTFEKHGKKHSIGEY